MFYHFFAALSHSKLQKDLAKLPFRLERVASYNNTRAEVINDQINYLTVYAEDCNQKASKALKAADVATQVSRNFR